MAARLKLKCSTGARAPAERSCMASENGRSCAIASEKPAMAASCRRHKGLTYPGETCKSCATSPAVAPSQATSRGTVRTHHLLSFRACMRWPKPGPMPAEAVLHLRLLCRLVQVPHRVLPRVDLLQACAQGTQGRCRFLFRDTPARCRGMHKTRLELPDWPAKCICHTGTRPLPSLHAKGCLSCLWQHVPSWL